MAYPVRNKPGDVPSGRLRQPVSSGIYLFTGQDIAAKEEQLKKIEREFLPFELQDFNLDRLYAKEIKLKDIQERLLSLPLKSSKRLIIIREAHLLGKDSRQFLLDFSGKPHPQLVLVLDFPRYDYKDEFIKGILPHANLMRFKEDVVPDAFTLSRQIEMKKADTALRILSQLLKNGEAPERILGGLRYAWEKQGAGSPGAGKRLKSILNCDLEIKTGRLKPVFALEKLVISLCLAR
ncbi:MAG: hypothetical protein WC066_02430 [Candidatus Omnitrophota bacterium]|jgi:hypothetical protein